MTPPTRSTALRTASLLMLLACGADPAPGSDTNPAGPDSGALDVDAVSTSLATAHPTTSCSREGNRAVSFSAPGCPTVTLAGAFFDQTDGSSGQITGLRTSHSSMSLTWDDHPLRGDCDLDIASEISWSASRTGRTMTISVTDRVVKLDTENRVAAGYAITDYGTTLRESGGGTRTFTYACEG